MTSLGLRAGSAWTGVEIGDTVTIIGAAYRLMFVQVARAIVVTSRSEAR